MGQWPGSKFDSPPENQNNQMVINAKKRGGKRPGAGRRKGSVARATREQKGTLGELARQYTATAMATLAHVAANGESESARVAASIAILDRGFGKPPQAVELTGADGGPIEVTRIERVVVDPADTDA